jgi:ribonuclease HIII
LDYQRELPVHADAEHICQLTGRLQKVLEQAGVSLVAIRSRAVFPEDWNELLDEHGNKSTVLSVLTLRLLAESLAELGDEPVAVICDKHGGRNSYQPLLQRHVTDFLVEVYGEGPQQSVYRWGPSQRRTQVMFCTKAERYLPAALASMASKYLRELAMLAFNDFWGRHLPGLKPTAGYPLDAGRFKADIAAVQAGLNIDDRIVWRNR